MINIRPRAFLTSESRQEGIGSSLILRLDSVFTSVHFNAATIE